MKLDKSIKHIHLIAIGGIGMSAIARYLYKNNYKVTGSDRDINENTELISKLGIKIQHGHDINLIKDADLVIYSAAINEENPEMKYARKNNIPLYSRSEFMGKITEDFGTSVAVSGVHGKTTVTSMIATMMKSSKFDPTIFVGAYVPELDGNCYFGKDDIIINETCEYKNSYHDFDVNIATLNNIELDHTDFYDDIESIKKSFRTFIEKMRPNSTVIMNCDDKNVVDVTDGLNINKIGFAIENDATYTARNIRVNEDKFSIFDLYKNGKFIYLITLSIPGRYNIYNALSAISVVDTLGCLNEDTIKALKDFKGANRRFELKQKINSTLYYDDYAHHPTAIKELIKAIKEFYPTKKLHMAFQPHTYSRTHSLFESFAESFKGVDKLYILDIYAAREENLSGVSSKALVKKINTISNNATYIEDFQTLRNIAKNLDEDNIFFTVGAGDIYKIYPL